MLLAAMHMKLDSAGRHQPTYWTVLVHQTTANPLQHLYRRKRDVPFETWSNPSPHKSKDIPRSSYEEQKTSKGSALFVNGLQPHPCLRMGSNFAARLEALQKGKCDGERVKEPVGRWMMDRRSSMATTTTTGNTCDEPLCGN